MAFRSKQPFICSLQVHLQVTVHILLCGNVHFGIDLNKKGWCRFSMRNVFTILTIGMQFLGNRLQRISFHTFWTHFFLLVFASPYCFCGYLFWCCWTNSCKILQHFWIFHLPYHHLQFYVWLHMIIINPVAIFDVLVGWLIPSQKCKDTMGTAIVTH